MAMVNGPIEPILREHLICLFEAMMRLTGRTAASISVKTCNGAADMLDNLRDQNATFSAYTYDRCVANISAVWPDDQEPWPADIPRFYPSDVRVKRRRRPTPRAHDVASKRPARGASPADVG